MSHHTYSTATATEAAPDTLIDSPRVRAARVDGSRTAFVALLADGDAALDPWHTVPDRELVMLTPTGEVDWATTPLPGGEGR